MRYLCGGRLLPCVSMHIHHKRTRRSQPLRRAAEDAHSACFWEGCTVHDAGLDNSPHMRELGSVEMLACRDISLNHKVSHNRSILATARENNSFTRASLVHCIIDHFHVTENPATKSSNESESFFTTFLPHIMATRKSLPLSISQKTQSTSTRRIEDSKTLQSHEKDRAVLSKRSTPIQK